MKRQTLIWLIASVAAATFARVVNAQIAISPTTGPWYMQHTLSTCAVGQAIDQAAEQLLTQMNAAVEPGYHWELQICQDYNQYIGTLLPGSDEPRFTVPPCAPEKNRIESSQLNPDTLRCTFLQYRDSHPEDPPFLAYIHTERHLECPPGFIHELTQTGNPKHICTARTDDICPIGDPVSPVSGVVFEEELDYSSGGPNALEFRRYYNGGRYYAPGYVELGRRTGGFTNLWGHSYSGRVHSETLGLGVAAIAVRPDGRLWLFDASGAQVHNHGGGQGAARIEQLVGGTWKLTLANSDVEMYTAGGQLASITTRAGFVTTITYGTSQITVTDGFGRTLTLALDGSGRINSLTNPAGGVITYGYTGQQFDGSELLVSATYPDLQVRQYTYATVVGLKKLATIVDENNQTFASFTYGANGLVSSSQRAGGAEHHGFEYTTPFTLSQNPVTTVTDPLGQARTYTMRSNGGVYRLSSITGGPTPDCGNVKSKTYDANGNVSVATDFNNVQTSYSYDLARNLETSRTEAVASANARTITTTWHTTYRLPLTITEPNRTTAYTYDAAGNVLARTITDTSVTPNVNRTWTYTYNAIGQILSEDGPRTDVSDTTTYTYYNCSTGYACGQLHTITNALGQITTFNTYNAHGQPLTITDPNSTITTLSYDNRQRLTSQQVASEETAYSYWPIGLLKRTTLPDNSYIEYQYDNAHRLTEIADGEGNRIVYALDAMGNRTSETAYDPSNMLSRTRAQVFNTLNRLWKEIGAAGTGAVTTTFTYDGNGNQTGTSAPGNRNTTNQYDQLNRLKQVTDPGSGVTQFGYDANDNLTSVTDPRNLITSYVYNGFGELTSQTSPDTGVTTHTYDPAGNLKTKTDARSITGTYSYDALHRISSISYPDQTVTFGYDSGTNGTGRLTSASGAGHSLMWTYDSHGRVATKVQVVGSVARTLAYTYTNGNLTSLTTPSGQVVTYNYSQGKISSISVNGGTLLNGVLYEPFGPIRQWTWGNSTLAVRTYDDDGKVNQVDSGGDLSNYYYDDAFRITGIDNTSDTFLSWVYVYDTRDRLTFASGSGHSLSWGYDANANRLSYSDSGSPSFANTLSVSPTSNRLDSISGSQSSMYAYDDAGNVTSETNARRPVSLSGTTTTTYTYNALSQRVAKSVGGVVTHFVYDEAGHLLGEYTGTGALIQETVWMGDIPVATLRPKTGGGVDVRYVHTDHLNTPRKITRSSDNAILWRWDPAPFGDTVPSENPQAAGTFRYNLRFPGQYYDAESGLNYNYFRDYDPATGRYVESDPIGLDGGLNPYLYANANPASISDESGLVPGSRSRKVNCNLKEWEKCDAECRAKGTYAERCKRVETWMLKRIKNREEGPLELFGWKKTGIECSCKESYCERNPATCALGLIAIIGICLAPEAAPVLVPALAPVLAPSM